MMQMKTLKVTEFDNGDTELIETPDELYILKLSSWVTRHLALFRVEPTDTLANKSAWYIIEFMKKLDCPVMHLFPTNRTEELKGLDKMFRTSAKETDQSTTPPD